MNRIRGIVLASGLIALAGSIGTLVLSEIMGLVPCELCWYQRYLLYPQVFLIWGALVFSRFRLLYAAVPLSLGGVAVAAYHSWLQLQPTASGTCSLSNPCASVTLRVAGLSIPNLSLGTFLALSMLLLISVTSTDHLV
ncbi:MAG: disulfide bond formation protein B [Halodesulfurarchaeum sp.]